MEYCKLNYQVVGSGKNTVVFLHGWGGSIQSFAPVAKRLDATCYLIDLYGFGDSTLSKAMDIYEYAIQLYLFFIEKGLHHFTLVGHSFGGRIAILLASVFNLEISNLVLVDSAGLKYKFNLITYMRVQKYKIAKVLHSWHLISDAKMQKFGSKDFINTSGALRITFVKVVNQHLDYIVPRITIPTLIVWGTKDKQTPLYMAHRLHCNIVGSGVVFYNGSGHFSYLQNLPNFVAVLNNFVGG